MQRIRGRDGLSLVRPLAVAFAAAVGATSQAGSTPICDQLEWLPTFGDSPMPFGSVWDLAVFDDGSGSGTALYVAGDFISAGGVTANRVSRWDGTNWSSLGSGMDGTVRTLAAFDDGSGSGPALYAGGDFFTAGGMSAVRIAKWNGTSWSPLGSGMDSAVWALTGFDDGSGDGPALYAAGEFTTAGGIPASRIAKWNGSTWSAVGDGTNSAVWALTVFDDGSGKGPALYAGGYFLTAGGITANRIAKWDGAAWSALGTGMNDEVYALKVFDDGSGAGPALYAGGVFTTAGGVTANAIARWDGTSWSALSGIMPGGAVRDLSEFDDGSGGGPALIAAGSINIPGGVASEGIAKWDGTSWLPLGIEANSGVGDLAVIDDASGAGPALYATGDFDVPGGVEVNIAKWNGTSWSAIGPGFNHRVFALTAFDDDAGAGSALYAGGIFTVVGGGTANHIARWDGKGWSPLGSGTSGTATPQVVAMTGFDDGGGPDLYVAGGFTSAGGVTVNRIARWNGTSWSALGTGLNEICLALTVFDDGAGGGLALYAGGFFSSAGGVTVNRIARWNGTSWSALGSGMNNNSLVNCLAVFDDGAGDGPALYAGGTFTTAGGVAAARIARWDGTAWSALGSGMNDAVHALTVFDDGSGGGAALYAGGRFTTAGGVTVNRVAKWNGSTWSALSSGVSGVDAVVFALTVFEDGAGPKLYAGGDFTSASGTPVSHIARWDGANWSGLGGGLNEWTAALTVFDDSSGGGNALYVGGIFTSAIDSRDSYLAKWGCPAITGDLDGDGVVGLTDFQALLNAWGPCPQPCLPSCPADLDGDCAVGIVDFLTLLNNWTV